MKKLTIAFLFFATVASAEFTAQEKTELRKIGAARSELDGSLVVLSNVILQTGTEANRAALAAAAEAGVDAVHECHQAGRHLLNAGAAIHPSFVGVARAEVVTRGIAYVASCEAKTVDYANKLRTLNNASATASANRLDQVVNLESFVALPFTNWQPPSYPRIIGPHGTYDPAQEALARASQEFLIAQKAVVVMYRRVPSFVPAGYPGNNGLLGLREMLRYGSDFLGLVSRVMFLDAGAGSANDESVVSSDFAAGSGIRTREFFVPLRAVEINSFATPAGTITYRNFAGRLLNVGAPGPLEVALHGQAMMSAGYASYVRDLVGSGQLTAAQALDRVLLTESLPAGLTIYPNVASMQGGWLQHAQVSTSIAWKMAQSYDAFVFLFFHELPLPPPGTGGGTTCGAGTHMVGTECLPDPCPTITPEMVLTGSNTAEARCVQQ